MKQSKIASYIIIFNLIVTPLIFLPNQSVIDYYYFPKHFIIVICSLLFLFQIWLSRKNLKELFVWDSSTKAIIIYLMLISVSLFFAIDFKLALSGNGTRQAGFSTIIMYVLMFFAARASKQVNWKIYVGMLASAMIISVYGILQHFGFDFFQLESIRSSHISYGTIGNPNFLGTYLVLMIPFSVHFWFSKSKKIALVTFSVLLFCLLATMSRGPWLGAIGSISAYIAFRFLLWKEKLCSRKNLYFFLTLIITILVYLLLSGESFLSRFLLIFIDFSKIIGGRPDSYSVGSYSVGSYRWFIWSKIIDLIRERPIFGFGISNLGLVFTSRYPTEVTRVFGSLLDIDEAHNEYLGIAVSSGIPALVAYIYFLYTVTINRLRRPGILDGFNLPIFCALIGYTVQAFFNINIISVAFLFWIFLGLFAQKMHVHKDK